MNPGPPVTPGSAGGPTPEPPFLSLHTAVVLLTALVLGLVTGGLTAMTGAPVAGAVLAGLSTASAAVPALRSLISQPREGPSE